MNVRAGLAVGVGMLALASLHPARAEPNAFGGRRDFAVGDGPRGIIAVDFNSDNRLDLAVTNFEDNDLSILYGQPDGGFGGRQDYAVGTNPHGIVTADFDGDTLLDLAVTNWNGNDVSVLYGQPNGMFAGRQDHAVGSHPTGIVAGDFDGDDLVDLATANWSSQSEITVLYAQAGGGFGGRQDYAVDRYPFGIVTADFNDDDLLDLAVTNNDDNEGLGDVVVLYGQPDGTFGERQDHAANRNSRGITTGDFNGDGYLDLAFTAGETTLLFGQADGHFSGSLDFFTGGGPDIVAGDFNDDGLLDVANANGGRDDVGVAYGQPGGGLGGLEYYTLQVHSYTTPGGIAVGDFDRDGRLDLAVTNTGLDEVSILYAQPIPDHVLTIVCNDGERGFVNVCPYVPGYEYRAGTELTLTGVPTGTNLFKKWKVSGPNDTNDPLYQEVIDTNNPLLLTLAGGFKVKAFFKCGGGGLGPMLVIGMAMLGLLALRRKR